MDPQANIDRLRDVLEGHGADAARWPDGERAALLALVSASPDAAAVLDDARRLARVLDDDAMAAPSTALRRAILARAPQPRRSFASALAEFWAALGGARIAAPAFALALAFGAALGVYGDPAVADDEQPDLVDVAQLATDYPDF